MRVWTQVRQICACLGVAVREWTGAEEYERLARSCRANGFDPPDRGRYFAQRLEEKYSRGSRCC